MRLLNKYKLSVIVMASQETQQETQGSSTLDRDQPPLWEHVNKLEKQGTAGGAWKFSCKLCGETRQGSYSRVKAHLLGLKGHGISRCMSVTPSKKQEMQKLEEAYEKKKAESNAKEVALPCETGVGFKKRKGSLAPLERAFGVEIRDQLDQEIARMFYTGGLPFNLARNPHYTRAFQFAAANKIDGYVPPSYNKLRTTLLQKEKENVHRQLEPLRSTWKEKGVTIVSDGWSDPTRKPLINFMATSGYAVAEGRPVRRRHLPCCGIGTGWLLFIIGFFLAAIPWYVGAFILMCARYDHREKPGYIACLIAAIIGTIVVLFGVSSDDWDWDWDW